VRRAGPPVELAVLADRTDRAGRDAQLALQAGVVVELFAVLAVLTSRLKTLVREGVLSRDEVTPGVVEYRLTERGIALWPVVHALTRWGDESYSPAGSKRAFRHEDGGLIGEANRCEVCGSQVPVTEIRTGLGPGYTPTGIEPDPVSKAISQPRLLLEPVTTA
jgi:hypothetical protein